MQQVITDRFGVKVFMDIAKNELEIPFLCRSPFCHEKLRPIANQLSRAKDSK